MIAYEGRSWLKCLTRRFVMALRRFVVAFRRFGTPILLVDSLFSEVDSANNWTCRKNDESNWQLLPVRLVVLQAQHICLSFRRFVMAFRRFDVAFHRFDSLTHRGYNSTYITWSITWFHALIHEVLIHNFLSLLSFSSLLRRGSSVRYITQRILPTRTSAEERGQDQGSCQ